MPFGHKVKTDIEVLDKEIKISNQGQCFSQPLLTVHHPSVPIFFIMKLRKKIETIKRA